jgi:DNA ligase D-like protein (predicted 3'-phosphoesterase)
MPRSDPLSVYRRKRDFAKTAEPPGGRGSTRSGNGFVVQLHDASTRHFDFRLEVDGVLKSWAVPKGFSADPRDKRLAVPTEDHPLEYRDFEGVIEPGQYGAGTVLIWDQGTYRNQTQHNGQEVSMADALAAGHASFWLEGKKLRGGYALTRFREGKNGRGEAWLLVKRADEYAAPGRRYPVSNRARSVRSGRTLKQVAEAAGTAPSGR